jgi:hypothetical protein
MVYDKLACHHPAKPASADIKSEIRLRHWRHSAFCILFLACVFSMNLSLNAALLSLFILCFDIRRNEASWRACVRVCVCAPVISCLLCSPLATLRLMPKELISARQHLRHHCVFKSQSTQFCSRDLVVDFITGNTLVTSYKATFHDLALLTPAYVSLKQK